MKPAPAVDEDLAPKSDATRPVAGALAVLALIAIMVGAVLLFRGSLHETVPLTVISERAGLVMNPDAKVQLLGVQVGRVRSIEDRPEGKAAIRLEIDRNRLAQIPENVQVNISSPTVFGAKSVQLVPPADASAASLRPGQVLSADHVTVEFNTTFQQLTQVLSKIQPEKLNETLGAISTALNGRGAKFGQTLSDLDHVLAKLEPSLPALNHDIEAAPAVLNAYADAAPDLVKTFDGVTRFSQTIVDKQQDLDTFLVSATGLADVGNDVLGTNRQPLSDALHLLVPTTDLLNEYHEALYCGIGGLAKIAKSPPLSKPGTLINVSFELGVERYRYPANLPKVAARGGPQCGNLPIVPPDTFPKFVVGDVGANPWQYGNQGILLNSDALKQYLFGPLDGPPRNTAQIGQPG